MPAPAKVPDWLQEIAPAEAAPPVAKVAPEAAIPAPAEVPDWLQEIAPAEAAPPVTEVAPEAAVPAPAEVPDWLQDIAPAEAAPPVTEVAPEAAVPAPAEAPDRLQEIAPEEALVEAAPAVSPLVDFSAETETPETLQWLSELDAETPPAAAAVPALEGTPPSLPLEPESDTAGVGELVQADIPAWMQAMRPRAVEPEAAAEEEPLETEGLLKGLRGVLTPAFALEAVAESAAPTQISAASLTRAQLLQSLLAQPAETPQPETHKRGPRMAERVQRWLVTIVLLAVAVVTILTSPQVDVFSIPALTQPIESPETSKRMDLQRLTGMYNTIQGLSTSAEDTVLVAFEYGPAEADELDLVAKPILQHLFNQLEQGAHIFIVSTRPEGLAMATGVLDDIIESEQYTETQYSLLDYRPGDAIGVSQLLTDVDTLPKLIVVLTAQPGPLRWWIEQTRARGAESTPIVAGISAALEPAASPYLDVSAGQLAGAISGLGGAATYERKRGIAEPATQWRLNALAMGHIAIVCLMIVGAALYAPGSLRRRKQ